MVVVIQTFKSLNDLKKYMNGVDIELLVGMAVDGEGGCGGGLD